MEVVFPIFFQKTIVDVDVNSCGLLGDGCRHLQLALLNLDVEFVDLKVELVDLELEGLNLVQKNGLFFSILLFNIDLLVFQGFHLLPVLDDGLSKFGDFCRGIGGWSWGWGWDWVFVDDAFKVDDVFLGLFELVFEFAFPGLVDPDFFSEFTGFQFIGVGGLGTDFDVELDDFGFQPFDFFPVAVNGFLVGCHFQRLSL